MSRTTPAYLQRPLLDVAGDPLRLFLMGANHTRTSWQQDPVSGLWYPGWLGEPARISDVDDSGDLSTGNWTKGGGAAVGSTDGPDGKTRNVRVSGLGTAAYIYCLGMTGGGGSGTPVPLSFWLRYSSASYDLVVLNMRGVAYGEWTVDLSALAADQYHWIHPAHPAVTVVTAMVCDASGRFGPYFKATGNTLTCDICFPQDEVGAAFPTSSIETVGTGSVQRTADSKLEWLTYVPDEFSVQLLFSIPEHTPAASTILSYLWIDGGNHIGVYFTTAGKLSAYVKVAAATEASVTPNVVVTDGKPHRATLAYQRGRLALGVDGAWAEDSGAHLAGMNKISLEPSGARASLQWRNEWLTGQPRPVQPDMIVA